MAEDLDGPHLAVAVLCEYVIEDKRGVLSLIGIVDRVNHSAAGQDAPERMPPFTHSLNLVLTFKSGFVRGTSNIRVRAVPPEGPPMSDTSFTVLFEGDDRGVNLVMKIAMAFQQEGLYWFDVYVGERRVTRIPLRVVYQRLSLGSQPGFGT